VATPFLRTGAGVEPRAVTLAASCPADGRVESLDFRRVLGMFTTGVVAVTAYDGERGEPVGLTANSFSSVSLDPPLVSVCIAEHSSTWERIRLTGSMAVNILAAGQSQIAGQLARRGPDKFAGLSWRRSPAGHPLVDGALGWLDCELHLEVPAGDHVIAICRVTRLAGESDGQPLVFYRGCYGALSAVAS
jgi:3-hydroxy-9,10-secoandrosta-1,3,5(10)-triene-9,17-dione monooxygenase reductase component